MARNDIVLLDGILDQRIADVLPSRQSDEVFEYLAFEQVLKDYDLSREEIESGWVDGRDDGGVDGFFTIVNGRLLRDPDTFVWPKRHATLDVVVITAKHHATFQQAPLNNLLATLLELFDLGREKADLKGAYSAELLKARAVFHLAYRRLASITPVLSFRFVYASRGDAAEVAENISARAAQIRDVPQSLFSSSRSAFDFVGATELVSLYRRTKTFSLSLPFVEYLSRSGDSYVLVTSLADYSAFVTDETGHLRRYLFDSNVRDYLGENRVNEDIGQSLCDGRGPEFCWLNNGVTILATGATVLGKFIQLQDVQIVNGLQTTESVFKHFNAGAKESAEKGLLVKVVVSTDITVRDQIIRATNNQSLVEPQSLHATDKIQRDIEDILERHGWFYERRKNYYRNIGKPPARFVTPMYIAAGFVALALRNPDVAARLKSRFMRNPEAYALVFSDAVSLEVWPAIAEVLKRSEETLEIVRPGYKGERFLARSRNLLGLLGVARALGKFSYTIDALIAVDKSKLTVEMLLETWNFVKELRRQSGQKHDDHIPASKLACVEAAKRFGLDGIEQVGRRKLPGLKDLAMLDPGGEAFIQLVNEMLPPQPWKQGIHFEVARQLSVKSSKVSRAIQKLIARGKWLEQRGGTLYSKEGGVVAIAAEPPDQLPK
jgi:hypothetical protein